MPRVAWKPTKADLKLIEKMSSKGATQKAIYNALGISEATWKRYRRKELLATEKTPRIKKAMEAGERARREDILKLAEDSLKESIKIRKVIETKTVTGGNENGSFENTTVTEKEILPNPTILMFALVNATNSEEGKPIRWQSINKVEVKQENNTQNKHFNLKWTKPKDDK